MFFLSEKVLRIGGASLLSQYPGGRGRWITETDATLLCRMHSRTAGAAQKHCPPPQRKNEGEEWVGGLHTPVVPALRREAEAVEYLGISGQPDLHHEFQATY